MENFQLGMQIDAEHMQNIFGGNDAYIRQIEDDLKKYDTGAECDIRVGAFPCFAGGESFRD